MVDGNGERNLNLYRVDLQGANLAGCSLVETILRCTNLRHASLQNTSLRHSHAHVRNTRFHDCDPTGTVTDVDFADQVSLQLSQHPHRRPRRPRNRFRHE